MAKPHKKRSKKLGLPPGAMVHVGEKKVERITMSVLDYDEERVEEKDLKNVEEAIPFKETPTVTWLNVNGLHDVGILKKLGDHFNIHPLILEDILNTHQRPKIEVFDDYVYIVLKMIGYNEDSKELNIEQVSLILGPHYVITLQERPGDIFDSLRTRIRDNKGRIRRGAPDYLTYAIIDIVVDHYFLVLEKLGETIEIMEDAVVEHPTPSLMHEMHYLKSELIALRKAVWPLREMISTVVREEIGLITENSMPYFHDIYDHTIQVVDTVETYRDMVSGLLDVYLSSVSNKMNEVMKVLTIIATIFIPLTFIAGIYGMNFDFMPELHWRWAYPAVWGFMLVILVGMIVYFRKKKWL